MGSGGRSSDLCAENTNNGNPKYILAGNGGILQNTRGVLTFRSGQLWNKANFGSLFTTAERLGRLFPPRGDSSATNASALFAEAPHRGTLARGKFVHLIDYMWCDRHGVFLKGWAHAHEQPITAMSLCSGDFQAQVTEFEDRPDVLNFYPHLPSTKCGFAVYLACSPFRPVRLVAETPAGWTEVDITALPAEHPLNAPLPTVDNGMADFINEMKRVNGTVVEIGARVVGPASSLQAPLFKPECKFIGVDIHAAPGVDVVADAHFLGDHFEPGSIDGIMSFAVMEHLACPWLLAAEINKVLKVGGLTLHSLPQAFPIHETPNDFWRASDEALKVLFSPEMGFEILKVGMCTPLRMYVHPDFREGAMHQFPLFDGMASSFVLARKTFDLPGGAVAWPLQKSQSIKHSQAYPAHGSEAAANPKSDAAASNGVVSEPSKPAPRPEWVMPERTKLLLSMFDASGFGLEVGPSYNPLLPKSRGFNVETIDHADAATLREKYKDNASQIEEVDYVSDGRSILETIGKKKRYDFIYASHVIEHVTDIVRFIQDCETLLKPDGRLVLAVPDKRFCFDALRPLSTVGQALQSYFEERKRHSPAVLFDQAFYACCKAQQTVWIEPTLDDVALMLSEETAKDHFDKSQKNPNYQDAHGWQFTPTSFRYLVKKLRSLGYIKSGEMEFHTNPAGKPNLHEFYITLSKSAPVLTTSDVDLIKQAEQELRGLFVSPQEMVTRSQVEALERDAQAARQQIENANRQIQLLTVRNDALLHSTSWKVTAPLRYIRSVFL
ncbi:MULTISPECIES: methyltransferase domain-containing protein [unclassified Mesorhizobium]|uniref:methyltransferase domain-containing protein n=1 Tax=unclassified Mesorhizobium TaxID=325217 RepID=UPI003337669A